MIRIGRGSKAEQPNEETNIPERSPALGSVQQFQSGNPAPTGQALTESETMARDIKEGRLSGFVGNGTVLTGETNFQSMLRVDGHLTGSVASDDGTLIIGSTGRVDANIDVSVAIVNGIVNGDIIAAEKLELGRTAKVAGNIQAPRLTIEDGAVFEGSCSMLKAQEEQQQQRQQQREEETAAAMSETETAAETEVSPYEVSETIRTTAEAEELEDEDELAATEDDDEESFGASTI